MKKATRRPSLLQLRTAAIVQVFGRRDDAARHALRWPAAEKRQGTKSRDVGGGVAAGAYGDFAAGSVVRVEERSGSEAHLASWDGHDGERERAAGVLQDEILRVLVLMTRRSDVAARA